MPRERTETGYDLFPEGTDLTFTITKPAEKGRTQKGKYYYVFRMETMHLGRRRKYSEAMMTWMSGDLLRALGCTEIEKNSFDWDRDEIVGRQFIADVVHEPDYKDASKMTAKLRNIRSAAPDLQAPLEQPEAVTAGKSDDDIPF